MNVKILNSGSKGNTAIIDDFLIIDVGWPEIPPGGAVLLTHSHTDHSKYLDKVGGLPVYCTEKTARQLAKNWPFLAFSTIVPNTPFKVRNGEDVYLVLPIELKHDVPCVGFEILRKSERILWLTDFYKIVDEDYVVRSLRGKMYDHVYIECNNTLEVNDLVECFLGEESPKDTYHRRKSFENHCNIAYIINLFRRAGYSEGLRYDSPVTLLHRSASYYYRHVERISDLCKIVHITNPFI